MRPNKGQQDGYGFHSLCQCVSVCVCVRVCVCARDCIRIFLCLSVSLCLSVCPYTILWAHTHTLLCELKTAIRSRLVKSQLNNGVVDAPLGSRAYTPASSTPHITCARRINPQIAK